MTRLGCALTVLALFWAGSVNAQNPKTQEQSFIQNQFGGLDVFHDPTQIADTDSPSCQNIITDNGYLEKRGGDLIISNDQAGTSYVTVAGCGNQSSCGPTGNHGCGGQCYIGGKCKPTNCTRLVPTTGGDPVRYIGDFPDQTQTHWLITESSSTVYATNLSTTPVAIGTSSILDAYALSMQSGYYQAVFSDGIDAPWEWNGVSSGSVGNMPVCRYELFADQRMYCANVAGYNYRLEMSSSGGVSWWTPDVPLTDNGAGSFDFNPTDGYGLECLANTPWGKFVGKRYGTWLLQGTGQNSYSIYNLDPVIGCVDNRSVQMLDGNLYWLALDGVYAWNGAGAPVLVSQKVTPLVQNIQQASSYAGAWTLNNPSDFGSGNTEVSGPGAALDTDGGLSSDSGLAPGYWTVTDSDSFSDDALTNILVSTVAGVQTAWLYQNGPATFINAGAEELNTENWTPSGYHYSGVIVTTTTTHKYGSYSWQFPEPVPFNSGEVPEFNVLTTTGGIIYSTRLGWGLSYGVWTCDSIPLTGIANNYQQVELQVIHSPSPNSNPQILTSVPIVTPTSWNFCFQCQNSFGDCITDFDMDETISLTSAGTIYSNAAAGSPQISYDTTFSTPIPGVLIVTSATNASNTITFGVQQSSYPTAVGSYSPQTPGNPVVFAAPLEFENYEAAFTMTSATMPPASLVSIQLQAQTTGVYYSPVQYTGVMTTSATFVSNITGQTVGGSVAFGVRSSSYVFTTNATTPLWVTQVGNGALATELYPYVQWESTFTLATGSDTIDVSNVTLNWQVGTGLPVASEAFNHRYFLCAIYTPTDSSNDGCLVFQDRNGSWTFFEGNDAYYSLGLFQYGLVGGDASSGGNVWKMLQAGIYADSGQPIDSVWESKIYLFGAPNQRKSFNELWADSYYSATDDLSAGFAVNRSTSFTTQSFPLTGITPSNLNPTYGYFNERLYFGLEPVWAKYLQFQFSNDNLNQYMRINNYATYYDVEQRTGD